MSYTNKNDFLFKFRWSSGLQTVKTHSDVGDSTSERKVRRDKLADIRSASGDGGAHAGGAPGQRGGAREPRRVRGHVGVAAGGRGAPGHRAAGRLRRAPRPAAVLQPAATGGAYVLPLLNSLLQYKLLNIFSLLHLNRNTERQVNP